MVWSLKIEPGHMIEVSDKKLKAKRATIARAALEWAITSAVRSSDPQCNGFVGVIVERVAPTRDSEANWAVKGLRYGRAQRSLCDAAVAAILKPLQLEFDIFD
jgi:hypothetical protein